MATKTKKTTKTRAHKRPALKAKTTVPADTEGRRIKRVGAKQYDLTDYEVTKSAGGNSSLDNGDTLARKLRGVELDEVYSMASKTLGEPVKALRKKYEHLNVGMQRMNLGNRIRAAQANA